MLKIEVIHAKKSDIIRTVTMGCNVKDDMSFIQIRTMSSSGNRTQTHGQLQIPNFLPHFSHLFFLIYVPTKKILCNKLHSILMNCTLHCASHVCYGQRVKMDSVSDMTCTVRATVKLAVCHSRGSLQTCRAVSAAFTQEPLTLPNKSFTGCQTRLKTE